LYEKLMTVMSYNLCWWGWRHSVVVSTLASINVVNRHWDPG